MDPSQSPSPSPEAWFNQLNQPPSEPPSNKPRRTIYAHILLITLATLLLLGGEVAAVVFIKNNCFKPERYTSLVSTIQTTNDSDVSLTDVAIGEPLYYHEIRFTEDTADISTAQVDDPTLFLNKLAKQYKSSHKEAPFVVHLKTKYLPADSSDQALRRLEKIKTVLVSAGLNSSAIIVDAPAIAAQDADSLVSDDAIDGFPVNLSITPTAPDGCTP